MQCSCHSRTVADHYPEGKSETKSKILCQRDLRKKKVLNIIDLGQIEVGGQTQLPKFLVMNIITNRHKTSGQWFMV